jgi:hypothetical protein
LKPSDIHIRRPDPSETIQGRTLPGSRRKASPIDLRGIPAEACKDFEAGSATFDDSNGDDPEHLLKNYPPKVSVSTRVNSPTGVSNRMIGGRNYLSV